MLALWIILGLILFAIILLFMPFCVYAKLNASLGDVNNNNGVDYQTSIYWPWRLLGIRLVKDSQRRSTYLLLGNWCYYERKKRDGVKKKPKKKKEKSKRRGSFLNLLRDRDILGQLIRVALRFLRDVIRAIRRPRLAGDVELGFSDPAAMGMLCGFMYAISPEGMILDNLRIRPNYVDTVFSGELDISTSVQPARIIGAFIKMLFRLPKRRLLRLLRNRKKSAKQEVN